VLRILVRDPCACIRAPASQAIVAYVSLSWPLAWTVIFFVVTIYSVTAGLTAEAWLVYWHGWTWFVLGCAILVTSWSAVGGIFDLKYLFRHLRCRAADPSDAGRVEAMDPAVKGKLP
jgi:membrane protein YdbS with pleckstrin-like domain